MGFDPDPQMCLRGLRKNLCKLNTDCFRVAICMLVLQHVNQEFYTFKCRVRSLGLVLDISINIDILVQGPPQDYGKGEELFLSAIECT